MRFGVVVAGMAQLKAGIVPFGLRLIAAIMSNRAMEFSDTPQGEASGPLKDRRAFPAPFCGREEFAPAICREPLAPAATEFKAF